jgi:hypothetical protein
MGFWDLAYFSWFAFLGLAVCAVVGAAIWDATAPKRRLKKAARDAARKAEPQEEIAAEETESEEAAAEQPAMEEAEGEEPPAELLESADLEEKPPTSEFGFEDLDEQKPS